MFNQVTSPAIQFMTYTPNYAADEHEYKSITSRCATAQDNNKMMVLKNALFHNMLIKYQIEHCHVSSNLTCVILAHDNADAFCKCLHDNCGRIGFEVTICTCFKLYKPDKIIDYICNNLHLLYLFPNVISLICCDINILKRLFHGNFCTSNHKLGVVCDKVIYYIIDAYDDDLILECIDEQIISIYTTTEHGDDTWLYSRIASKSIEIITAFINTHVSRDAVHKMFGYIPHELKVKYAVQFSTYFNILDRKKMLITYSKYNTALYEDFLENTIYNDVYVEESLEIFRQCKRIMDIIAYIKVHNIDMDTIPNKDIFLKYGIE